MAVEAPGREQRQGQQEHRRGVLPERARSGRPRAGGERVRERDQRGEPAPRSELARNEVEGDDRKDHRRQRDERARDRDLDLPRTVRVARSERARVDPHDIGHRDAGRREQHRRPRKERQQSAVDGPHVVLVRQRGNPRVLREIERVMAEHLRRDRDRQSRVADLHARAHGVHDRDDREHDQRDPPPE
jgi:hypothetical protein